MRYHFDPGGISVETPCPSSSLAPATSKTKQDKQQKNNDDE